MAKNKDPLWIEHMHMNKGALRRRTRTPKGKNIPKSKIKAEEKKDGTAERQATLAETLEHLRR